MLVVWVSLLLLWLDDEDDDDDEEDDDRGTYPAYVGQAGSRKTTDLCALVWWLLTEACGRFLLDVRETLVEDAAVEDMRDSPNDVAVSLTSAGAGKAVPGRRYVASLAYGM